MNQTNRLHAQVSLALEIEGIETLREIWHKHGLTLTRAEPFLRGTKQWIMTQARSHTTDKSSLKLELERDLWHLRAFDLCAMDELIVDNQSAATETADFVTFKGSKIRVMLIDRMPPPTAQNTHDIYLTTGGAFGSGLHPTTALMLRQMEDLAMAQQNVLDFGAGSGILALAALALGASSVTAVELDSDSLSELNRNLTHNPHLKCNRLRSSEQLPVNDNSTHDIVLANLPIGQLLANAQMLSTHIKREGMLLVSGFWEPEESVVINTFAPFGLAKKGFLRHNEWISLLFYKKSD